MCDKGLFVKSHCMSESSSSACVVCADDTYMDHPNGLTKCFRCSECDPGVGLIVKDKCTSASNTVCECKAGHYCLNQECDWCQEHTVCPPGEYVKTPGTVRTDAVCEKCPPVHFSNKTNSTECLPWRECSKLGLVLVEEGTSTTDSICTFRRGRRGVIGSVIASAVLFSLILTILIRNNSFVFKPGKNETAVEVKNETVVDQGNDYPLSEEEVPIENEYSHGAET